MTRPARLRHNAFVYSSTDEYVTRAVEFLRDGLAAGEGAIVAHTRPGLAVMREALDPAWVWCSYDANELPDRFLEGVWQTHPEVVGASGCGASDHFTDPEGLFRGLLPDAGPLPGLRSIGFGTDVEAFRERLARELAVAGVPAARVLDMLLAASEVATNAIDHGGGVRDVRAGEVDGRFVCEIIDRGAGFDDPAAGYLAPRHGVGAGLWIARQLTWDIEFLRAPSGFTARIRL